MTKELNPRLRLALRHCPACTLASNRLQLSSSNTMSKATTPLNFAPCKPVRCLGSCSAIRPLTLSRPSYRFRSTTASPYRPNSRSHRFHLLNALHPAFLALLPSRLLPRSFYLDISRRGHLWARNNFALRSRSARSGSVCFGTIGSGAVAREGVGERLGSVSGLASESRGYTLITSRTACSPSCPSRLKPS